MEIRLHVIGLPRSWSVDHLDLLSVPVIVIGVRPSRGFNFYNALPRCDYLAYKSPVSALSWSDTKLFCVDQNDI